MIIQKWSNKNYFNKKFPKSFEKIGNGTFGKIFTAYDQYGNQIAVKKFSFSKDPAHLTTLREIRAIKNIKSKYVINILDVYVKDYIVYVSLPYFEYDLNRLILGENLTLNDVRHIFWQVLKGVEAIHNHGYIHRDLKSANLLINKKACTDNYKREEGEIKKYKYCPDSHNDYADIHDQAEENKNDSEKNYPFVESSYIVKICDFGMARSIAKEMTPGVVTLWYRAPELILGSYIYTKSVDVWSLGCILLEFFNKKPLFAYQTEVDALYGIVELCGSINEQTLPGCTSLPGFSKYKLKDGIPSISSRFSSYSTEAIDLAQKMLNVDPNKRISIKECLDHPFFCTQRVI